MRLYHVPKTRGSRVIWILEEVGATYDVVRISRDDARGPEHLARHPLGKVPVLEDDEGAIIESAAHCLYIADLRPEAGLIAPLGSHERALAYQWALFAMGELEPKVTECIRLGKESDLEALRAAQERFRKTAGVVEIALDGHGYLVADTFGVADVVCGAVLVFANRFDLIEDLPNVAAYVERLDARPARQRAKEIASA